jgi:hypothetical protein
VAVAGSRRTLSSRVNPGRTPTIIALQSFVVDSAPIRLMAA